MSNLANLANLGNLRKLFIVLLSLLLSIMLFPSFALAATSISISYSVHVQSKGYLTPVKDGKVAGDTIMELRIEGLKLNITNTTGYSGGIKYSSHVQSIGWQTPVIITTNGNSTSEVKGALSGTEGKGLRLEAIKIELTGDLAKNYDIYYRVRPDIYGWLGWAKNGEQAGTAGYGMKLVGLQICVLQKGSAAPANNYQGVSSFFPSTHMVDATIVSKGLQFSATAHIQSIGNKSYTTAKGSDTLGTTGQGLRLEALSLKLLKPPYSGGIKYCAHVQSIGWQPFVSDGQVAGTMGKGLRMEAIRISLTGEMAKHYDVYYRTHIQSVGWSGWAINGEDCGSVGHSWRMEALQVVILPKGESVPGFHTAYYFQ